MATLFQRKNQPQKAMSTEVCVDLIIDAIAKRERELIMTLIARVGVWFKLLLPNIVDRFAALAVTSNNKSKN